MNLIEQLGGYEAAKKKYSERPHAFVWGDIGKALLSYRRQHNIYEIGDKVVHPKFSNMNIYEICEIKGDLFTVFYDRKSHSFKSDVRHATPEEIAAGRRLP